MESSIWRAFKAQLKVVISIVAIIAVVFGSIILLDKCNSPKDPTSNITIENSPLSIDSIMPRGDLYIGSAIIEDYVVKRKKETHLGGLTSTDHTCIQIVKQKCCYKINLEKIKYNHIAGDTIYAKLPPLEYIATTQDSPFMSDDEDYWAKELPSTNNMKKQVENKIKTQFETKENKHKATLYAEEAVSNLLGKLGYTVVFVNNIEKKKE